MPPILGATADGSVKKGNMIGWILRRVREYNCDHKWGGPHEIRMYGRLTRHPEPPTSVRKVYICSKCLAKREIDL